MKRLWRWMRRNEQPAVLPPPAPEITDVRMAYVLRHERFQRLDANTGRVVLHLSALGGTECLRFAANTIDKAFYMAAEVLANDRVDEIALGLRIAGSGRGAAS